MRINVLDQWLDTLKTDKWKYLEKRLRIGDQCCASGVLCEIGIELGVLKSEWWDKEGQDLYRYAHIISPRNMFSSQVPIDFQKYLAEDQPVKVISQMLDDVMYANDESAADNYDDAIAVLQGWLSKQPESKYYANRA